MANPIQLAILKQGVEVWNKWHEMNNTTRVDLRGPDLGGTDLSGIDFRDARLTYEIWKNRNAN